MKTKKLIIVSLLGIALLAACATPPVTPPVEVVTATNNPAEETAVFEELKEQALQTVQAEQTAEALANPTEVPPSPTPEVIVVEPTQTVAVATAVPTLAQPTTVNTTAPVITNTPTIVVNPNYQCKVVTASPPAGQRYPAGGDFDGRWNVSNSGTNSWGSGDVDFMYISGQKMHTGPDRIDLPKNVAPGENVDLILDMLAPSTAGTYQSTWALQTGNVIYCYLTVSIIVE